MKTKPLPLVWQIQPYNIFLFSSQGRRAAKPKRLLPFDLLAISPFAVNQNFNLLGPECTRPAPPAPHRLCNGDWYEGFVYRVPGYVYYKGYKLTKKNELGLTGSYEITDVYLTLETAKYKNVYVNTYHDGESSQNFTPLNSTLPAGSAFLTSEVGYIISKTTIHYFGKGYDEADK